MPSPTEGLNTQEIQLIKQAEVIAKKPIPAMAWSIGAHFLFAVTLVVIGSRHVSNRTETVRLRLHDIPQAEPTQAIALPPKKKELKKEIASERKPTKPIEKKKVEPVQGLPPSALANGPAKIAAPVGNTLMVEDQGKRLKANEVDELGAQDLSRQAKLILNSITTPNYTQAAVDAGIEGTYVVDVFVDANGLVTSAEMKKKIGYDMDDVVIAAARQARFEPRQDRFGHPIEGWTELKFRLEIPN